MILGVDLGGADRSALELFSALSRSCSHLPLHFYAPHSQLARTIVSSPHHALFLADQEIGHEELPIQAIRTKKFSSLMIGLNDLKKGSIQAFLSLANTGALVLASSLVLGRLKNVHGPALVAHFPSPEKEVIVLDLGAYPKHTVERYLELVALGATYARARGNGERPAIGLLNIGHEATKGTDSLRQADSILKARSDEQYRYSGFVEPIDIFQGSIDVAVTDGFTGNVLLKTAEGAQEFLHRLYPSKKAPQQAALLLGVRGDVYKCHGRTSPDALSQIVLSLAHRLQSMKSPFYTNIKR